MGPMLEHARLRAGLGLREAARLAGISHAHLLRMETGQRTPSETVAGVLAELLRLDDSERARLDAVAVADVGRDWPGRKAA
jgi:transcriptional regulator with XRE-family HTH domain